MRLAIPELTDHAEVCLMMAGHQLSMWRENWVVDRSHIDQSLMHAEFAVEALRALQQRDRPGVEGRG